MNSAMVYSMKKLLGPYKIILEQEPTIKSEILDSYLKLTEKELENKIGELTKK